MPRTIECRFNRTVTQAIPFTFLGQRAVADAHCDEHGLQDDADPGEPNLKVAVGFSKMCGVSDRRTGEGHQAKFRDDDSVCGRSDDADLHRRARQLRAIALVATENIGSERVNAGELAVLEDIARNPAATISEITRRTGRALILDRASNSLSEALAGRTPWLSAMQRRDLIGQIFPNRSRSVRASGRSANVGQTSTPQAREPSPFWAASMYR